MDIINFGSLNLDYVYSVEHIVSPGETISSKSLGIFAGGKGLNQSIALARAGAKVIHAGMVGADGEMLTGLLKSSGVETGFIRRSKKRTGHAIIQLSDTGQNSIVLHGGANMEMTKDFIDGVLEGRGEETTVLLQNEQNLADYVIEKASAQSMRVCLNPSPYDSRVAACDLSRVSVFIMNGIEGGQITGKDSPEAVLDEMASRFPKAMTVLTLGEEGAVVRWEGKEYRHGIFKVPVVDSTAAGDTFTGFFLAVFLQNGDLEKALRLASKAASISVSRKGAANSIPVMAEVIF